MISFAAYGGDSEIGNDDGKKSIIASRISNRITIDGVLDEKEWAENTSIATGFVQRTPQEGVAPEYQTKVKILYNNRSVYIGAVLIDHEPDKILKQLGNRDDRLNSDKFIVAFDTYNKQQDAFIFAVTASGVQSDSRVQDFTYNTVWNSAVKINDSSWVVEMEIPYYAIRFPANDIQKWGLQFEREFRRTRGISQWSLVPRRENNILSFWGELNGIENIQTPTRLSFTPYITIASSNETDPKWQPSAIAGLDMKLGLNEGFTLDATLLPDFSQVRSDNIVNNLNLNEVVFAEQRTFFQEGVDLFNKGNLFYSRRIGDRPILNDSLFSDTSYRYLDTNEVVVELAPASRVLNVAKVSGRNKKGLGIGVLNAVTGNTYATVYDTETEEYRDVLTNPTSNYNIISLDQNLKNNNSIFLINTNVTRASGKMDANVTATGVSLWDKKSRYQVTGNLKHSTRFFNNLSKSNIISSGIAYAGSISRRKGKLTGSLSSNGVSPTYDANDMGFTFRTNYRNHVLSTSFNQFNPFWILNGFRTTLGATVEQNYSEHDINRVTPWSETWITTKSFHTFFIRAESMVNERKDYFASPDGRLFMRPGYNYAHIGISSDYRKSIALDGRIGAGFNNKYGGERYNTYRLAPIIRVNDHLKFTPSSNYDITKRQVGWAGYSNGEPIFGQRNVHVLTNIFKTEYIFKNNLSLSVRFRHYWQNGKYLWYADLNDQGYLEQNEADYGRDFNFNAFNTDIVFAWQYAPGSFLTVVYKTALSEFSQELNLNYLSNLQGVINSEQLSTLSFKTIYFFDANRVSRQKEKNPVL